MSVSEFLKAFPTYHLHREPEYDDHLWVFCIQDEGGGSQNNSSSADRQTTGTIQDMIKSALSNQFSFWEVLLLVQFWAPVEIGGRQLLSNSGQPFAVSIPDNYLGKYRQRSIEYDIVVNYRQDGEEDGESNPMIITSSSPVTAFLNRLTQIVDISTKDTSGTSSQYFPELKLELSIMIPICYQSSSSCVGVIEYCCSSDCVIAENLRGINKALEETGLSIFSIQERIPYKTVYGLEAARSQIKKAIKTVCASHYIQLAQVWIAINEDEYSVPFPSSLGYTRKKQILGSQID